MFRLYLDTKELILPTDRCQTLAEVIEVVKRDHLQAKALIQKLCIDGQNSFDLDPDHRNRLMSDRNELQTIRVIEIFTNTITRVANETIEGMLVYIDKLIAGLETISQRLRMSNIEEAFKLYRPAMEGIYWVMELFSTLERVFELDPSKTFNGTPVRSHLEGLTGQIAHLVEAQEKNDWIMMADILEYELVDTLSQWKMIFKGIAEQVAAKEPSKAA